MKSTMRKLSAVLLVSAATMAAGCQDFLDVNDNPNGPEFVTANLYLPPMIHWMVTSPQFDGRFIGRYTQNWHSSTNTSTANNWMRMGYDASSDNGAQQWRDVYWSIGQNLVDMIRLAEEEERWDLLGVGYILKAWGWQVLTDMHGEIIITQAFDVTRSSFDYDSQEFAYQEIQRLLNLAIDNLERTDGAVDQAYLAKGDRLYNGDRTKWLKLAYGMLALNLNHYSNKGALYRPADVIAAVNQSFISNIDDAIFQYPATSADNADRNFWGATRGNLNGYRQTQFIVGLMNGTQFGGAVDPRMRRMLSPSPGDTIIRGVDINTTGFGGLTTAQQPNNLFGYPGTGGVGQPGRYIFADRARIPVMTYAQLQFIKAEAAYRMGDRATALTAYREGISAHIDFVNSTNQQDGQTQHSVAPVTLITASEKNAFLANPNIVPTAAGLTLTHIMSQKYIAQWGWGHNEQFMDMRRYNWTDVDPASGRQVFPGFAIPNPLFADNLTKPVERIRPRFNSEYIWNVPALQAIGGLASDYHTKPMWITEP